MRLYSGTHELYGKFVLARSAQETLGAWLKTQSFANRFEQRDTEWWLERIAGLGGSEIELYEVERSSYSIVEHRESFIDFIAKHASGGKAFLQHIENGFHAIRWKVANSKVNKSTAFGHRRIAHLPKGSRAEIHSQEAQSRQEREAESRSPADRFEEVIFRYGQSLRVFFLHGGDDALRRGAAEAIGKVMGAGSLCELNSDGSNLATCLSHGVAFLPEVETLPLQVQTSLKDHLRQGTVKLIVATSADPRQLVISGRLSVEFYYFISPGQLDLSRVHP